MYKAAVMGDRDSIYGFAALGFDIFPTKSSQEGADLLEQLANEGYAIIYMTESLFDQLAGQVAQYSETVAPAVIPVPGAFGNSGSGMARVRHFVEQAVGSDILFGPQGTG